MPCLINTCQRGTLRAALLGKLIVVCFGAGVDSTAMLLALRAAGLRPDAITFADTGGEKPETLVHIERMQKILHAWDWPPIELCRVRTQPQTPYTDLYGNCWTNETLPSLAFGMKSCSIRWKHVPQDQHLMGVTRGPNRRPPHPLWLRSRAQGQRIVKLIGYDCGRADRRRAGASFAAARADGPFDFVYPLQLIGWTRVDCVRAIAADLGPDMVPIKSACYFCPASRPWELFWLAGHHPGLLDEALGLERRALTGRHSRFDEVDFGSSWEEMVRDAPSFPSTKTTVGLGRSFAWNHWARLNGVVGDDFTVIRGQRRRFIRLAQQLQADDNALDARAGLPAGAVDVR